jgi:hypothetical protein
MNSKLKKTENEGCGGVLLLLVKFHQTLVCWQLEISLNLEGQPSIRSKFGGTALRKNTVATLPTSSLITGMALSKSILCIMAHQSKSSPIMS